MTSNLFSALRDAFPADLDQVAIEAADGERLHYTWRDVDRASAMLANLLGALDLPAGSRVMAQVDKSVEGLLLCLAVLRAGLVVVPLDGECSDGEVAGLIANAAPAVLVCGRRRFQALSRLAFTAGTARVFTLDDDRSGSLLERAAHRADAQVPAEVDAHDADAVRAIGTAQRPASSHADLIADTRALHALWTWSADDVLMHVLPVFPAHVACAALLAGARMLWFNRFEPRAVADRLPDATLFVGTPTIYGRLLAEPRLTRESCRTVRGFASVSAPLPIETVDAFRERTGHTIVDLDGRRETPVD